MKRVGLEKAFGILQGLVNGRAPGGIAGISTRLPTDEQGELAFYKLTTWGYVLFNEAARIPTSFLIELRGDAHVREFKQIVEHLRTYLCHNLSDSSKSDRRKLEFIKRWFRSFCQGDFPESHDDFIKCVSHLENGLANSIESMVLAAELLYDPIDGPRLVEDLQLRISRTWPAYKFDEIAAELAIDIGLTFADVRAIREKFLPRWREALAGSIVGAEVEAVRYRVLTDLVSIFGQASRSPENG